jgi:hypothetical protein
MSRSHTPGSAPGKTLLALKGMQSELFGLHIGSTRGNRETAEMFR